MYQIWRIYLDLWGHDCKKYVWPTFGCKLGQSDPIVMQLKLDMSCHLLNVYTKFQIDISKHVEEKSGKRGRTDGRTNRRTEGRTLPRHNTSRFSNGRIKINNCVPCKVCACYHCSNYHEISWYLLSHFELGYLVRKVKHNSWIENWKQACVTFYLALCELMASNAIHTWKKN